MSQYFNPIEGKRNYVDTVTVTDDVLHHLLTMFAYTTDIIDHRAEDDI